MFISVVNNNAACVTALAEAGADLDLAENRGKAPLRLALEEGYYEVVRALARGGASMGEALEMRMHTVPNTQIIKLLNAIALAGGSWEDYVASLRMPFVLLRKLVRDGGKQAGGPASPTLNWVFGAPAESEAVVRPCPDEIFSEIVKFLVE